MIRNRNPKPKLSFFLRVMLPPRGNPFYLQSSRRSFPITDGPYGFFRSSDRPEGLHEGPVLGGPAGQAEDLDLCLGGLIWGENEEDDFDGLVRRHIGDSLFRQSEGDNRSG